eukprot:CAMPEP_0204209960 /NCGR_PEP_ID=MMETSP0361-20130328/73588_1 /ASSEMBLY_ACC=CAM_ASM_000343 /TAXON_ID=268821 /ORGANISM="Scrippsiella Hangoei, Strain SHTV-5" /LENGTH=83 /DNA_ID=CAMNT_0051174013 /DNA_START=158 /DNA_END=406 /DNA_ORIENTATION=+
MCLPLHLGLLLSLCGRGIFGSLISFGEKMHAGSSSHDQFVWGLVHIVWGLSHSWVSVLALPVRCPPPWRVAVAAELLPPSEAH